MEITWEKGMFWHTDCIEPHHCGIMKTTVRESTKVLVECLYCKKRGYYPYGKSGSYCTEEITK